MEVLIFFSFSPQIELGNMTKEHLELVYSRKKLPYEKKNVMPGTSSSMQEQNETVTLITIPNADHQQVSDFCL